MTMKIEAPKTDASRSKSNELYNGAAGWVWAPGNNTEQSMPAPLVVSLTNTSVNSSLDPTVTTTTIHSRSHFFIIRCSLIWS